MNVTVKICVLLLLLFNGFWDMRKREVHLISLGLFFLLGLGLNLYFSYQTVWEVLGGLGIGLALLLTGFLSKEAVGFGDGFLLAVTGLYLGFWGNFYLLTGGAVLCAVFVGIEKLRGKMGMKDRIPFVPFLAAAYTVGVFL